MDHVRDWARTTCELAQLENPAEGAPGYWVPEECINMLRAALDAPAEPPDNVPARCHSCGAVVYTSAEPAPRESDEERATGALIVPDEFKVWAHHLPPRVRRVLSIHELRQIWELQNTRLAAARRDAAEAMREQLIALVRDSLALNPERAGAWVAAIRALEVDDGR